MRKLGLCVLATAITLGVCAAPAVADDTECVGALSGTHDNVVVPRGQDCTLSGADVKGNVNALPGSTLTAISNRIGGNVEGDAPRNIALLRSPAGPNIVGGNVAITGVTGPGFPFAGLMVNVAVCDTVLAGGNISVEKSRGGTIAVGTGFPDICGGNELGQGNILVQQNVIPLGELFFVSDNEVGGNLQVFRNRGNGSKAVNFNIVRENLQCRQNEQPFTGSPNFAGKTEGQCSTGL
jgi:hypothetical protein